jgi:BolA protein
MKEFLKSIKDKIKKNLITEEIVITDNTQKHKKHKFFNKEKYHISLEIKSDYLSGLSRLDAQRTIMKILESELKYKIHALEIKIK